MIHMSDLTEFTRVRGLIEAEIVRLSLHQPTASDLAQLKIQIETLESLAGDTELGVHRPERPRFPEKPVFMPPPVLPSLPECDRAIQMSTELASRLELLNAEITALKKANKPTKILIRQLKQFDRSRNSILNSIRREDAPAELAKQYDEKLRERSRYFKETNNAELVT